MSDEVVLEGGIANRGMVVRLGDRVHRPRCKSAALTESLLVHLEAVGFGGSPRFLGEDERGRQVLSFVSGDVYGDQRPPWIEDEVVNAHVLGRVAAFVRRLHEATREFVPPAGVEPFRSLPLPGETWNHADVHYGNIVFDGREPIGLIDWDCCAPGSRLYDPSTLMLIARCPKPSDPDSPQRQRAASLAFAAVLDGYGATDDERAAFPASIAATVDDVADFLSEPEGLCVVGESIDDREQATSELRWQAKWWRESRI